MDSAEHLYIHVPFCSGKCAYCAFYSVPYRAEVADRFLATLQQELTFRCRDLAVAECDTIYIGGGTPSRLSPSQWGQLLLMLSPITSRGVTEWTVEANPGTLTPSVVERLVGAGVNRVSLGVQSFDDGVLSSMQRRHVAADVEATVGMLRTAGINNVGLDLIAGLPGVDAAGWDATLAKAVELEAEHLSVYALGVEAGSALFRMVERGDAMVPDDDPVLQALWTAARILEGHGYQRYEISNYARPERECRHNLSCWRGGDYLGLGPAASSRVGLKRWTNAADLGAYCESLESGGPPPSEQEEVDPRTDLVERLIFGLRLSEGVPVASQCKASGDVGQALWQTWQPELSRLRDEGLLVESGQTWKASPRGRDILDTVLERLVV